jgi:hypothetical protein
MKSEQLACARRCARAQRAHVTLDASKPALHTPRTPIITETDSIRMVLFGTQNRTFGPCLAADNRIRISVMMGCASGRPHFLISNFFIPLCPCGSDSHASDIMCRRYAADSRSPAPRPSRSTAMAAKPSADSASTSVVFSSQLLQPM